MITHIRNIQSQLDDLSSKLRKIKSKQVSQIGILELAKSIVDYYFRYLRNQLEELGISGEIIDTTDQLLHSLLEATHKYTTLNVYKKLIPQLKSQLIYLEKHSLKSTSIKTQSIIADYRDEQIILTLNKLVPSSALSYQQAILDLQQESRLTWRGPATDLREALRECLDYLAPDKEVQSESWYKKLPDLNGPSMSQKAKYILTNRRISKKIIKSTEDSVSLIDELLSTFVRNLYSRANISTHTPTEKSEVIKLYELVRIVFCELLSI